MIYSLKSTNEDIHLANGSSTSLTNPELQNGKINVSDLVNSMRPHVYSRSPLIINVIEMMEPAERDQFALLLVQSTPDSDLLRFETIILERLSSILNSWNVSYHADNAQQQLRVDTAIQGQLIAKEIRQIRNRAVDVS